MWASSTYNGTGYAENSDSYFQGVAADENGRIYVAGYQTVNPSINNWLFYYGPDDSAFSPGVKNRTCNGMVVAYDGTAETALWASSVANATETGDSGYYGVAVDGESVYVAGDIWFDSGEPFNFGGTVQVENLTTGLQHAILAKYDLSGNAQWVGYPTDGSNDSSFQDVTVDTDGIIHVAGYQSGLGTYTYDTGITATGGAEWTKNAVLVSYNSTGIALNALSVSCDTYGGSEHLAVTTDTAGNIYTAGSLNDAYTYTYSTFSTDVSARGVNNSGGSNISLVKYGPYQ